MIERLVLPLARAYAVHAEVAVEEAELRLDLERRLAFMPWWARAYMGLGSLFVSHAAPALLLGRFRSFGRLNEEQKEILLRRLQQSPFIPVKAGFLGVKSLILAACYGRARNLAGIGYSLGAKGGEKK